MAARWMAAGLWAAVAASSVFWGLRLASQGPGVPAQARWVDTERVARGDVARLFATPVSSGEVAAPASSRFRLLGVFAPASTGGGGVALLTVDDKPARAYRQGAVVEGQTVVRLVSSRRVELGPAQGAATAVLELPVPTPAARGVPTGAPSTPSGVSASVPLPGAVGAPPVVTPAPPMPQGAPEGMAGSAPLNAAVR